MIDVFFFKQKTAYEMRISDWSSDVCSSDLVDTAITETRMPDYQTLLVEKRGRVTLITLNRPQALNALNAQVLDDLLAALAAFDADEGQGCAVLTGSDKAFAAGADIKEMADMGFAEMYGTTHFAGWDSFTQTRKPVIAAVAGYALGGGFA